MKKSKSKYINTGALFYNEIKDRLSLFRIWDKNKPYVMFIGLNPSTADSKNDDPTIRRCVEFSKAWGFGGMYMMNLFTTVTSDPSLISNIGGRNPVHEDNVFCLRNIGTLAGKVVFSWGSFKILKDHSYVKEAIEMFPEAYCLGFSKNGNPKHPLYLKKSTPLIKYNSLNKTERTEDVQTNKN